MSSQYLNTIDGYVVRELPAEDPLAQRALRALKRRDERQGFIFQQPSEFILWNVEGREWVALGNRNGLLGAVRVGTRYRVYAAELVPAIFYHYADGSKRFLS